jgi:hypothetical protein
MVQERETKAMLRSPPGPRVAGPRHPCCARRRFHFVRLTSPREEPHRPGRPPGETRWPGPMRPTHREIRMMFGGETFRRTLHDTFEHLDGFGEIASGKNNDKLLSAVATGDVRRSQRIPEYVRERAQGPVAGIVPEHIVQLFEVIEVSVGDGIGNTTLFELAHCTLQAAPSKEASE